MSTPFLRPGLYRHFKTGTVYQVERVGKHSETLEYMVSYRGPDGQMWFRPYEKFVEPAKLEDGTEVVRFEHIPNDWM